jgi:hypothetical protein
MKDDKIGREPQFFGKWKTTVFFGNKKTISISREMKDDIKLEDDLNFKEKGNTAIICLQMEDDIYFWQMEDELNFC